ncbi:hypothetical protein NLI96_g10000 [Meripilus lineatus]|uniref:Uncharacterized protein n=1 Tax=Meripilus lineatus TaxID=2056292 RepID=A0AAD5YAH4_9APHY|nr:hypothetical protein NLI96_g10000 [Physisporinus lineatus]
MPQSFHNHRNKDIPAYDPTQSDKSSTLFSLSCKLSNFWEHPIVDLTESQFSSHHHSHRLPIDASKRDCQKGRQSVGVRAVLKENVVSILVGPPHAARAGQERVLTGFREERRHQN